MLSCNNQNKHFFRENTSDQTSQVPTAVQKHGLLFVINYIKSVVLQAIMITQWLLLYMDMLYLCYVPLPNGSNIVTQ